MTVNGISNIYFTLNVFTIQNKLFMNTSNLVYCHTKEVVNI